MAKEVKDSVRTERIARFLLKNGIVVKIEELNRLWNVINRNAMYFIWRNMKKRRLATIINILKRKGVSIEKLEKEKESEVKFLGSEVEIAEIDYPPVDFERLGQAGKKCPYCGYVDPAWGASRCPNCDERHSK